MGTRGKRIAGKKKPKSIKAKVTSKMNSKRRLSRMGKEMKKVGQRCVGVGVEWRGRGRWNGWNDAWSVDRSKN